MNNTYFFRSLMFLVCAGALSAQTITVDRTSLTLSGQYGGAAVSQTLNIGSSGGATPFSAYVNSGVTWLKVNNAAFVNGSTPAAITVTADPSNLAPKVYSASIAVYSGAGSLVTVQVSFAVSTIGVSAQSLQFGYTIGGTLPAGQSITLTGEPTAFSAAANTASGGNWLSLDRTNGSSPGSLTALLNPVIVPGLAAGTYAGSITITPTSGNSNIPATVPVTLTVSPTPPVAASPAALSLLYQIGGANNQPQTLTLSTTASQAVSFSLTQSANPNPSGRTTLFILSPSSGTVPAAGSAQVSVGYDTTAALLPGTYSGKITVLTPGGTPPQQDVPVTLLISNLPLLTVPSAGLSFTYELGATNNVTSQNVTASSSAVVNSSTAGQMSFTISATGGSWLSVPASGTTGTPFSVTVNPGNLAPGTYTGTVTVTGSGAGNGPQSFPVTLKVANDPVLQASPIPLAFPYQIGQTTPVSQLSQAVSVASSTGAVLNYTATAAATTCGNSWLGLSGATTGTTSGSFTVTVNPAGLSAGKCDGTVTIAATNPATGAAAIGSPVTIPVSLYVSNNPLLVVTPASLAPFTAQQGDTTQHTQTITLASTNPTVALTYSLATTAANCGTNWLFINQVSGATPGSLTISVLPGNLSAGTCTGSVTVTATGPGGAAVDNSPVVVPIAFQVTAGTLTVNPTSLSFKQALGGTAPPAQTVALSSSGQALSYAAVAAVSTTTGSVNWLSVTPASGTTSANGSLTVSVDGSKLAAGTYQGAVTVTSPNAGNSPATIAVTFTVTPGTISATPASLTFTQVQGGPAPAAQPVSVSGAPGALSFTVSAVTKDGAAWLAATPAGGSTPGTVQVSANAGPLPAGAYSGTIAIAAAGASAGATGSPVSIAVALNVLAPQTLVASPANVTFNYTIGGDNPPAQNVQLTSSGTNASFSLSTSSGAGWLQVTPTSGNTPGTLSVGVDAKALTANTYTATITIGSPNALTPATVSVTLKVTAVPTPVLTAVKNAASWAGGGISPGENIIIGGTGLGPDTLAGAQLTADGKVATSVADTQVLFDNTAAPIVYAWGPQTAVMVPYEVAGRPTTTMRVVYKGVQSDPVTYNVVPAAPGIYTLNQAGSGPAVTLTSTPVAKGSPVALYMTGEGVTNPSSTTGGVAPVNGSGLNKPVLVPTATVGAVPAVIDYYGSAPGVVYGVMQINVRIPADVPSGPQQIVVTLGTAGTQAGVTVAVQ